MHGLLDLRGVSQAKWQRLVTWIQKWKCAVDV